MKRLFFASTFLVALLFSLMVVPKTYADCVPLYGGGESCTNPNLSIVKSVFNPATNTYVHDLGINDTRFGPGQKVSFKIVVANTGNANATHVVVTDFLPSTLLAVAPNFDGTNGPAGATITMQANTIAPGESAIFTVVGQVVDTLPQSVSCSSNQAHVTSNEDGNDVSDFSQFCVEQAVNPSSAVGTPAPDPQPVAQPTFFPTAPTAPTTPITTLPPTGPEALPLLGLFPTGIIGIILRKVAKRMKG